MGLLILFKNSQEGENLCGDNWQLIIMPYNYVVWFYEVSWKHIDLSPTKLLLPVVFLYGEFQKCIHNTYMYRLQPQQESLQIWSIMDTLS